MNLTDVEAKKFYHYGNTLTFLCDDETMTAANANESSKADLWYAPYNVYLTNRFTSSIISRLYSDPATSLRDLYNVAFTGTLGSHVTIYNADNYGNLYQNTMREFLGM